MPAKPKKVAAKKVAAKKVAVKTKILPVEQVRGAPLGNGYAAKATMPAPKQARSHPSLEWWLSQPDNVLRLKQILADPVFVAACHYVEGTIAVTPDDLIGSKAALDEVIVRKAALAAGVKIFTTTIASLPNFRKQQAADVPEPWGHIQAPIR